MLKKYILPNAQLLSKMQECSKMSVYVALQLCNRYVCNTHIGTKFTDKEKHRRIFGLLLKLVMVYFGTPFTMVMEVLVLRA